MGLLNEFCSSRHLTRILEGDAHLLRLRGPGMSKLHVVPFSWSLFPWWSRHVSCSSSHVSIAGRKKGKGENKREKSAKSSSGQGTLVEAKAMIPPSFKGRYTMQSSSTGRHYHSEQSKRTTQFERKDNERWAGHFQELPDFHSYLTRLVLSCPAPLKRSDRPTKLCSLHLQWRPCLLQQALGCVIGRTIKFYQNALVEL